MTASERLKIIAEKIGTIDGEDAANELYRVRWQILSVVEAAERADEFPDEVATGCTCTFCSLTRALTALTAALQPPQEGSPPVPGAPTAQDVVPYPICACGHRYDHHRHHAPEGCYRCKGCRGYAPPEGATAPTPDPRLVVRKSADGAALEGDTPR